MKAGNMKKSILAGTVLMTLFYTQFLYAQDQGGDRGPGGDHHGPPPFVKECAAQLGITLPNRDTTIGSGQQVNESDRDKLHACAEALHEKMQACLTASGIAAPTPGSKPNFDASTKAIFDSCHDQALGTGSAESASTSSTTNLSDVASVKAAK